MTVFEGAGVAIITPFHEDGSINYDKLDELIDFHCANGTDAIVICGTTGESSTLSEEEHMDCVKFTIERTKGRLPVIAGTGSNSTYTAIEMSREASEAGADGLLQMCIRDRPEGAAGEQRSRSVFFFSGSDLDGRRKRTG